MAAGSIVVDLLARTGSFETDMDRATRGAEKRMKEMEATATKAGAAIGLAFTGAAAAAVAFGKNIIDGLDALNDLGDATGASIANISALEDVAGRAGTKFDTVSTALVKFNDVLSKGGEEGSKAARVLQQLGLNADELSRMDPAQALHETAKALTRFTEDGDRARAVQILFGKSTREVAAFLKDLSEQSDLVAKVTKEEAEQAEAFNKQLSAMHKHTQDLARSLVSDLLPAMNKILEKKNTEGFFALFGFDKDFWDTKALAGKAQEMKSALEDLNRVKREFLKGSASQEQVDTAQAAFTAARGRFRLADAGHLSAVDAAAFAAMNENEASRLAARLRVPFGKLRDKDPKPTREKEPPKFPDDDFDNVMKQLEGQLERVRDLSAEERVLSELVSGRIKLSTDPMLKDSEEGELLRMARAVDLEKERKAAMEAGRERSIAAGMGVLAAGEDYQARIARLTGADRFEQQWKDLEALSFAFEKGTITGAKYTEVLDQIYGKTDKLGEVSDRLAGLGFNALEDLAAGGAKFDDVLKRVLQDLAHMIYQLGVMEPAMEALRTSMKSDGGGWWKSLVGGLGSLFGGGGVNLGTVTGADLDVAFRAGGGPVEAGKPYIVGERRPELFIPRTAGMILPNTTQAGAAGNLSIVNQTQGRVDQVQEQRLSNGDRVLFLQQAREAVAQDLHDPNSRISQSLHRNTTARRQR
jgi:hypothetical protein